MRDSNAPYATIKNLVDPATFACLEFNKSHSLEREKSYYAVNLRDVLINGDHYPVGKNLEEKITKWFSFFVDQSDKPVRMVPMHTFSVGFDDRIFLYKVARALHSPKVEIVSVPKSLWETMDIYYNAYLCIGMRFHAIVLQTLLNGNNYILDYTLPNKGKIISFMRQLNMIDFYRDRYISLFEDGNEIDFSIYKEKLFHYNHELVTQHFSTYVDLLNKAFDR